MARRILFYTNSFGGGGAEIVFARLAAAFADGGDDVTFAADVPGPVRVEDRANLKHVLLGAGHRTSTVRLRGLLRQHKPDASFSALGAHNLKHLAAAILAGRRRHCVIGFHGFAAAEAKPFSLACFWAAPLVTRLAARTICVSDTLLDDIRNRWRGSRKRTLRIYNPIPLAALTSTALAKDVPPLVLSLGRLIGAKRFEDLIAAIAAVHPQDTRLAILGTGPERARIVAAVSRLGLEDRVELPGYVDDPTPWYQRASCVAITSETESFGLTAAEALSYGTPVVTTDCGGPVEVIETDRYGRTVPIGDIPALTAALTKALADPAPAEPRRRRAERFSLETIRAAYAELVDSLS